MSTNNKDIKKKNVSASADQDEPQITADEISEENLERAVKRGMKTPHIKVISRLLLGVLLVISIAAFGSALVRYGELQREKEALEQKLEEYEAEVEKLEYLIDCPVDYNYIVRVAREKLNLHLPDEIIYYNDTNGK